MDSAALGKITKGRRKDRAVDELVGVCRGLLADGHVNIMEAQFLRDWIERYAALVGVYPFSVLYERISTVLQDGFLDPDEERDLLETLVSFVGGEAFDAEAQVASLSTSLPLCNPPPPIVFPGALIVVTGTFACASRSIVEAAIVGEGAMVQAAPHRNTDYLVIGELASRDWQHSTYGRKIERAVELRADGCGIHIVSEAHWYKALSQPFA